jgi:hypothetical protein
MEENNVPYPLSLMLKVTGEFQLFLEKSKVPPVVAVGDGDDGVINSVASGALTSC